MFINLNRLRKLLGSNSNIGLFDSPADNNIHGRRDGAWIDSNIILPISPTASLDFNDNVWKTLTGNYSAVNAAPETLTNDPFETRAGEVYDYIIETITGVDGSKQFATARSTQWEGERNFIRTADSGSAIIDAEWKFIDSFYLEIGTGATTGTVFTTILTHTVDDDTTEQITFLVYGVQVSGTGRAFMRIEATVCNVVGVSSIIGSTLTLNHVTSGVIGAQVIEDTADVLLQVKGTNDDWDWKVEVRFEELRI